jgi:hypothetical protein
MCASGDDVALLRFGRAEGKYPSPGKHQTTLYLGAVLYHFHPSRLVVGTGSTDVLAIKRTTQMLRSQAVVNRTEPPDNVDKVIATRLGPVRWGMLPVFRRWR